MAGAKKTSSSPFSPRQAKKKLLLRYVNVTPQSSTLATHHAQIKKIARIAANTGSTAKPGDPGGSSESESSDASALESHAELSRFLALVPSSAQWPGLLT